MGKHVTSAGLIRRLTKDNPLWGADGLSRRARGRRRLWVTVGLMVLLAHGVTALFLLRLVWSSRGLADPMSVWVVNFTAPHIGGMFLPLVALLLMPGSGAARGLMRDLRLAGLTPGQISAWYLRHAIRALALFQCLWLAVGLGLLLHPRVVGELAQTISWANAGALIIAFFFGGLLTPWLLLAVAWAVMVRTGRYLAVVVVIIPLELVLNPYVLLVITNSLFPAFAPSSDVHLWLLELICVVLKSTLAAGALIWVSEHFDRIIEDEGAPLRVPGAIRRPALAVAACYGLTGALSIVTIGGAPPYLWWSINLVAPHAAAAPMALAALSGLPRRTRLRDLWPAVAALAVCQGLWLGVGFGLWLDGFPGDRVFELRRPLLAASFLSPWLMLGVAWAVRIRWGPSVLSALGVLASSVVFQPLMALLLLRPMHVAVLSNGALLAVMLIGLALNAMVCGFAVHWAVRNLRASQPSEIPQA